MSNERDQPLLESLGLPHEPEGAQVLRGHRSRRRLEQLDGVAIGILDLNLSTARA